MKIYYLMYSFFYFIKQIFSKKHYDIIFYAPSHFNRGDNNENLYFKDLLNICKSSNISFIYFEEPDNYNNQERSNIAIPFDFIYYLVVLLRKFMGSEMKCIDVDKKIGYFISKIFFRNINHNNFITLSQSMLSLFNGINSKSKKFDLQHGTIHAKKKSYIYNGIPSENISENKVIILLTGNGFKDILIKSDKTEYFIHNTKVIGSNVDYKTILSSKINRNVLVSLQFTHDHTYEENLLIYEKLILLIKSEQSYHFYLRLHPRFNNEIKLSNILSFSNTSLVSESLNENFKMCSFHLTTYSTITFKAALLSIPTSFIKIDSEKMNIFNKQYKYPFFNHSLDDLHKNYDYCSSEVKMWSENFHMPLSINEFKSILRYEK